MDKNVWIILSDDFDDPLPDSFWLGEEETLEEQNKAVKMSRDIDWEVTEEDENTFLWTGSVGNINDPEVTIEVRTENSETFGWRSFIDANEHDYGDGDTFYNAKISALESIQDYFLTRAGEITDVLRRENKITSQ